MIDSPWKPDFPALKSSEYAYLDSAATCQVPQPVIDAISNYLTNGHGNPGRGFHQFSHSASELLRQCRQKLGKFIGAQPEQIIFTKSTTESINLVAYSLRNKLNAEHSILVTNLEHHSNLLPWQRLSQQTGARLNILPIDTQGNLKLDRLDELLNDSCKLFAFSHGSNVLGNHPEILRLIEKSKQFNVPTLLDGAQFISHGNFDVSELDCDYYAFSGHKLYAPGGCGVLYAKNGEDLEPLLLGGGIVEKTNLSSYQLLRGNSRLEAGSANLVGVVGLLAAIEYLQSIGMKAIANHESRLMDYLKAQFNQLTNYRRVSHSTSKSILSFVSNEVHCHDIASLLAESNILVRAGHHCAQPCLNAVGVKHCVRVSLGMYNDSQDIDLLINGLRQVDKLFLK